MNDDESERSMSTSRYANKKDAFKYQGIIDLIEILKSKAEVDKK